MKKIPEYKHWLPYLGIPLVVGLLLLLKNGELNAYVLLLRALLLLFGYAAAWSDFKKKRVSNSLVLAMLAAWLILLVPQLFYHTEQALAAALSGALGFLIAGILFLLVYLISRKGLGGGDVKFMAAAGLYLGMNGVFPAMLWGAVLASIVGLILIATKKLGKKDTIPLVPFLYVGILLTVYIQ